MNIPSHRYNGAGKNGAFYGTEDRVKPDGIPRLCEPCVNGDHSKMHGAIGCVRVIEKGFVCTCTVRGTRR